MMLHDFVSGAIAMALFITGLFFLRFWRSSKDRFFLFFAIAFWVECANRALITYEASRAAVPEQLPVLYVIRLAAFLLILFAIYDKNRPKKTS